MKKLFVFVAIVCLVACGGGTESKVADVYLKAVVSQQVGNADESLVTVTPLTVDSLRTLIIEEFNQDIEREQRGLDVIIGDDGYLSRIYSADELAAQKQGFTDRIDAAKAFIEEVKTKEFPQYYLCSYNGSQFELVTTEDAVNMDDFMSLRKLLRTIRDDMKANK